MKELLLQKTDVKFNNSNYESKTLSCYVAKSCFHKIKGLKDIEQLSKDKGMIFPFKFSNYRFFTMKDVLIDLDIIFIDKCFHINKIIEAVYNTNALIYGYCKYVVETNKGFCKKNNIGINDTISIERW